MIVAYLVWTIRVAFRALGNLGRRLGRPADYIEFVFDEPFLELPPAKRSLTDRLLTRKRADLRDLGDSFKLIAADKRVKGVLIHARAIPMQVAHIQAIRDMVATLKAAGKKVVFWSTSYNFGTYYLATSGDEILMQTGGGTEPLGLRRGFLFLAEGLKRAGIHADIIQISPYKSAADPLTKKKMSKELKEMTDWLTDSLFDQIVDGIARGRAMEDTEVRRLIDESPFTDTEALESRLVDKCVEEEDLPIHLGAGKPIRIKTWDSARKKLLRPYPVKPGKYVALLRIEGSIVDGKSKRPPIAPPGNLPFLGEQSGDLTVVQAARKAATDKRAAAAVLYIDSGGGSATASEAMSAALRKLADKKPLVVSMGPVAGSGGYYVATPGRYIFAHSGTLTGSIGVLNGKIVTTGAYEKFNINREAVVRGRADMTASDDPFTESEREILWRHINRVYEVFLDRCAKSRGKTEKEIDAVGLGRVWTGAQALEHGLVDELGGLDQAIDKAKQFAGLSPKAKVRQVSPGKRSISPIAPRTAASMLEHLLEAVDMFNRANALCLMPVTWDGRGGGVWI